MSLLQMSFAGAVMIVAITVVRALCINRLPKITFPILWGLVLLRLLVPFSMPSAFSIYSLIEKYKPMAEPAVVPQTIIIYPSSPIAQTIPTAIVEPKPVVTSDAMSFGSTAGEVFPLWPVIWIVGMLLCIIFFGLSYVKCIRDFRTALPVQNGFVKNWLEKHRLFRRISVRQSKRIATPLTYGVLRPVILMPDNTDWENNTQIQYILTHEYVHIRRLDAVTKMLFTIALCIHWFNPLVWVMYVLVNRDIELSCDEAVVRMFGEQTKSAYAMTLIHMEERKSKLSPLYNHFSRNATEERVRSIMKIKKISAIALAGAIALVVGITAVFATSAMEKQPDDTEQEPSAMTVTDAAGRPRENEAMLKISSTEEVPATLFQGDGYSLYIPDEGWAQQTANKIIAMSTVDGDSNASIWVRRYEDKDWDQMAHTLLEEGFGTIEDNPNYWAKTDPGTGVITKIKTGEFAGDMWGVFYSYPSEDEARWAKSLEAITDTYAWSYNAEMQRLEEEMAELEEQKEALQAELFSAQLAVFVSAYFGGDVETMKTSLSDSYKGDIEVFEGSSSIADIFIKESVDISEKAIGDTCAVSVVFREHFYDDFYQYLTIKLIKEQDGWKVKAYGLEM